MEQCGEKIIRKRKLCFNNSIREECMFTIWDSVEKKIGETYSGKHKNTKTGNLKDGILNLCTNELNLWIN